MRGVVETVDVHQQRLGRGCSRRSIGHETQSLGPWAEVLDVNREHFLLGQGVNLLGHRGRGGAAECDGDSVCLVRTERRRTTEVDERATPRGQSLGVAKDESGVVRGGEDVDEAGGAGLGLGAQPPVPVPPPFGGVRNEEACLLYTSPSPRD